MGFEGFTVSDWEDIKRLEYRDRIAKDAEDAVRISVMAGLDMSMVPTDYSFHDHCVSLAKKDPKFMERVNDATKRILKVKKFAGLFENDGQASMPVTEDLENINKADSKEFNLEAARESIILAKNNGILPLNKTDTKRILVAGPSGDLMKVLNGGWSYTWQGI